MIDASETQHRQRERGRLHAEGQRTDNNSDHTLLVVHEADGSWAIHSMGAPGVRLRRADMVALAEKIRKRGVWLIQGVGGAGDARVPDDQL